MKTHHFVISALILIAASLHAKDRDFSSTSKVGSAIYAIDLNPKYFKASKWDYTSSDTIPVSPRQAEALATKALYQLRPTTEKWTAGLRDFTFAPDHASYFFIFDLRDPQTKKIIGNLPFVVTMQGKVISPKLQKKAEQGAAANP